MSIRRISKVAVIGSGIMGSGIACHFANIGVEVLLLDIAPSELTARNAATVSGELQQYATTLSPKWTLF